MTLYMMLSLLSCFCGMFDDLGIPNCRFLLCFVAFSQSLGQW